MYGRRVTSAAAHAELDELSDGVPCLTSCHSRAPAPVKASEPSRLRHQLAYATGLAQQGSPEEPRRPNPSRYTPSPVPSRGLSPSQAKAKALFRVVVVGLGWGGGHSECRAWAATSRGPKSTLVVACSSLVAPTKVSSGSSASQAAVNNLATAETEDLLHILQPLHTHVKPVRRCIRPYCALCQV